MPLATGQWAQEAIGIPDLMATGFEVALVAILSGPLASSPRRAAKSVPLRFADVAIARTFGILAIALLTGAAILEHAGPT